MCVIVHKERGKENPSEEIFQKCFNKNPHGAGILLHRQGTKTLEIHKGFMKFNEFKKAFSDLKIQKEDDAFFHFRITTSGGTSPENCHPFPISSNENDLKATRINTTRAFIHNGILGDGDSKRHMSDTQLFIEQVLSLQEIQNNLEDSEVNKLIDEFAKGNRFVVADAEKDIFKRYGTWYEDSGYWFSNILWKDFSINKKKFNKYDFYNDDNKSKNYYLYKNKPDTDLFCPYCDTLMTKMLNKYEYYICPKCNTLYNDEKFEIYLNNDKIWISLIDLNELYNNVA